MLDLFYRYINYLDLPDEARCDLSSAAERICKDQNQLDTAKYLKKKLAYSAKNYDWNRDFGGRSPKFIAFVFICAIEDMEAEYTRLGIDRKILLDTVSDLAVWIKRNKRWFGEWGFSQYGWLIRHMRAKLFKLGRIQFEQYNSGDVYIYTNKSGEAVMLPVSGRFIDANGCYSYDGGENFTETKTEICGCCAKSNFKFVDGIAVRENAVLKADEWTLVLQPGDALLNIHIPRGGALTPEAVQDSFEKARIFYNDYDFKAFCCFTWLFDPSFKKLLPKDSNILSFQNTFMRYTDINSDFGGLDYVYDNINKDNIKDAPRDTTFRKSLAEFIENGGEMRGGGGYCLK